MELKRQLGKKAYHNPKMVRVDKLYEALLYLKTHHPCYRNIEIKDKATWTQECLIDYEDQYASSENEDSVKCEEFCPNGANNVLSSNLQTFNCEHISTNNALDEKS